MQYAPVANLPPQFSNSFNELAAGYYLKFYESGTTTPLLMATDSTGSTTLDKCKINTKGYPISNPIDDDSVFIPYINQSYKAVLYKTDSDADANNTIAAEFVQDAVPTPIGIANQEIDNRSHDTLAEIQGLTDLELDRVYTVKGIGQVQVVAEGTSTNYVDATAGATNFELKPLIGHIDLFGAVGDWNGTTGTDNSAALLAIIASEFKDIIAGRNDYYFGAVGVDEAKFETTTEKHFNWHGAHIFVEGTTLASTASAFIVFKDVAGSMVNYEFTDVNYLSSNESRGVQPVSISNSTANTSGYMFGNFKVHKGQSLLTCGSSDPANFRASNIKFIGHCSGDNVYYGVNLANNGDDFIGDYSLGISSRAFFGYGTDGVDINVRADTGLPSSANLLISNSGSGGAATKNYHIHAHFKEMNGACVIADQPGLANGIYNNINVILDIETIGANLTLESAVVRIGAYAANGTYLASGTTSIDELDIKLKSRLAHTNPIVSETSSPNYGLMRLLAGSNYILQSDWTYEIGGLLKKRVKGDPSAIPVGIKSRYITGKPVNGIMMAKAWVTALNDTANTDNVISEYLIQALTNGTGVLTGLTATQVANNVVGTLAPVVSMAASGDELQASVTIYTSSSGSKYLTVQRLN